MSADLTVIDPTEIEGQPRPAPPWKKPLSWAAQLMDVGSSTSADSGLPTPVHLQAPAPPPGFDHAASEPGHDEPGQSGNTAPGGPEQAAPPRKARRIIEKDDREPVPPEWLPAYPWRAICHLRVTYKGVSQHYNATGFFIAPNIVATAAHVLRYPEENNQVLTATRIEVYPARKNSAEKPLEVVGPENFRICERWGHVASQMSTVNDYACLILSGKNLAAMQNHMEFADLSDPEMNVLPPQKIIVAGYSGNDTFQKWGRGSVMTQFLPDAFYHDIDTMPGQSGSPVIRFVGSGGQKKAVVLGIHSKASAVYTTQFNVARRVNKEMLNDFAKWQAEPHQGLTS